MREVVEVVAAQVGQSPAAALDLEPRGAQQKIVEPRRRLSRRGPSAARSSTQARDSASASSGALTAGVEVEVMFRA